MAVRQPRAYRGRHRVLDLPAGHCARGAGLTGLPQGGGMVSPPLVICPADEDGARRVRIDDMILDGAYCVQDVAAFLQGAGLQSLDEADVVRTTLIDWRGGGPDNWTN